MENEFDKLLRAKRNELDTDEPNTEALWQGVEKQLHNERYKRKVTWWRAAAVILALTTLGQSIYFFGFSPNEQTVENNNSNLASSNNGFQNLAVAYEADIETLESQLKEKNINPAKYANLFDELAYMDKVKQDVSEEILLVNNRERLAQMLADTYEKKIRLLERLLQQAEREEKEEQTFKEL